LIFAAKGGVALGRAHSHLCRLRKVREWVTHFEKGCDSAAAYITIYSLTISHYITSEIASHYKIEKILKGSFAIGKENR